MELKHLVYDLRTGALSEHDTLEEAHERARQNDAATKRAREQLRGIQFRSLPAPADEEAP